MGSVRVFIRPLSMLAIGAAAGLVMWLLLMAHDGHSPWDGAGARSEAGAPGLPADRLGLVAR